MYTILSHTEQCLGGDVHWAKISVWREGTLDAIPTLHDAHLDQTEPRLRLAVPRTSPYLGPEVLTTRGRLPLLEYIGTALGEQAYPDLFMPS